MKINIAGWNRTRLENEILQLGFPRYKSDQIYRWMVQRDIFSFDKMTDLSKQNSRDLNLAYSIILPEVVTKLESKDGTKKYLLKLQDGLKIEMVDMDEEDRRTLCVSSQVGCPLKCSYCATGTILEFKRNLEAPEIVQQVLLANSLYPVKRVTNVVFMGMGEPLLNYDAVKDAVLTLNDKEGLNLGARRITVSTVGIIPGIEQLIQDKLPCSLAVSISTVDPVMRAHITPIEKKYPLSALQQTLKNYAYKSKRKLTIEYLMLEEMNDSKTDARKLVKFLEGTEATVNLIPYNSLPKGSFKAPKEPVIETIIRIIRAEGFDVTVRRSKGADIAAACGQLAGNK
jgi:23S rRNA (adenine2503-C2)-methyltransferase